jgi:ribose transport system ATP-binding protein
VTLDSPSTAAQGGKPPFLEVRGASKVYDGNRVLSDVTLSTHAGEVLGLLGPNGAGKSTLLKIVGGVVAPSGGVVVVNCEEINPSLYTPLDAYKHGIYTVHQELSLFSNLTVAENFLLSRWTLAERPPRRRSRSMARRALDEVFPDSRIAVTAEVNALSLAQQQMVEIALAVSEPNLAVLILDEPTSALPEERVAQLHAYLERRKRDGISVVYVTHKLDEVLVVADRIVVLRDGELRWDGNPRGMTRAELVRTLTGAEFSSTTPEPADPDSLAGALETGGSSPERGSALLEITGLRTSTLRDVSLGLAPGEVVGLAGLEGAGQRALLREILARTSKHRSPIAVRGGVAYISGDRQCEGIFPLWSVAENIVVSALTRIARFGVINSGSLANLAKRWFGTLRIAAPSTQSPIIALSGGNQQKVIIARGLASEAQLLLLDDPTRGVDVEAKAELYGLLHEIRQTGRAALLYSTEDIEFLECDRVYVMRAGRIVTELSGQDITRESIRLWSYSDTDEQRPATAETGSRIGNAIRSNRLLIKVAGSRLALAAVLLAGVVGGIALANPSAMSKIGLELLLPGILPLVFATLAQMFIILAGGFDVGIGYAVGLANVISATLVVNHLELGVLALAGVVAAYVVMAVTTELTGVPAVVITLGASFVWLGLGLILQPNPGGEAPAWLLRTLDASLPTIPEPVYIVVGLALISYLLLYHSRRGLLMRALGNNRRAFTDSGWTSLPVMMLLYFLAGICVVCSGLMVTVVNTAGDINASSTLTLASVAAVVVGGAEFARGFVEPVGAVMAAVAFGLLPSLMAFTNVRADYVPAVEGVLIIAAMMLRLLSRQTFEKTA